VKKAVSAAALAAPAVIALAADAPAANDYIHIARTGTLHIDAPPDSAFLLFTGPGEKLWIEDWDPVVVSGDGLSPGTVFITDIGEETLWIIVDFDRQARHARYARFAPGSRAGTVEVRVDSDGNGKSIARVTYELTALSQAGNDALAAFDEAAYTGMLQAWEQMIRDADIDYESGLFTGH
jgi:hypothetical protein